MSTNGIDVSTWQGNIDWTTVQNSGINFAMIRATYGITGVDNQFASNMQGIASTSINPGAYHYCYARSVVEATAEANNFLSNIAPYKFTFPVAIDIENSSLENLGSETITDIAYNICKTVENAGYYVCIYSNLYFLTNYLNMDRLNQFDIWLAQWASQPSYTGNFGMWQYSSTGSIPGINGNVDLDLAYKDYPTIISNAGLNGIKNTSGNNDNPSTISYTVVSGDTLWGIAERFLGNGLLYTEIMSLNGLTSDIIYPGQVLKIPSSNQNYTSYTVVSGDTLWGIAERFLGNGLLYTEIMSLNRLDSDIIYPGQVLKIPS